MFYALTRLAHAAVLVFFVLSGFLVCGRGLERIHNNSFQLKNYCIDRTVRIMLPLVGAITLYFITSKIVGFDFDVVVALGNLFSLQGVLVDNLVPAFWSLAHEVWFYVLLAAVAMVFKGKRTGLLVFFIVCLVFSVLGCTYMLMWFIGGLAFILRPKKKNWKMLVFSFLGLSFFLIMLILTSQSNAMSDMVIPLNRDVISVSFSLFVALFIQQIILYQPQRSFSRILNKFLSKMADFSYTLYLSHRIVFYLLFYWGFSEGTNLPNMKGLLLYMLFLLLTMLLCYGLYLLTEKHTASVKKIIKTRLMILSNE